MSVVAAAVGPAGAAAYVPHQLCGSGARKRKDVVHLHDLEEEEEEISRRRGDVEDLFLPTTARQRRHHQESHRRHGLFVLQRVDEEEQEERSSIGAASDGEEEEEGDEADSAGGTRKQDALACMDALDDALPIKRGLSNFFSGKSRSFANLQDAAVTTAQDLAKPENPFNKRRRVLRCSSIRRVASTSLTALPPFLPPAGNNNTNDDDGSCGG